MWLGGQAPMDWREEERFKKFVSGIKDRAAVSYAYSIGIDLGKLRDRTVISTIETQRSRDSGEETHAVKALHVLKLGTDYAQQLAAILTFLDKPCFSLWATETLIDCTGLGEPMADLLDAKGVKFKRVSITSSGEANSRQGRHYVSRTYLINLMIRYLARDNFKISSDLSHAPALREELATMTIENSKAGNQFYASGAHDDLIMATSLALYGVDRKTRYRCGVTSLI